MSTNLGLKLVRLLPRSNAHEAIAEGYERWKVTATEFRKASRISRIEESW